MKRGNYATILVETATIQDRPVLAAKSLFLFGLTTQHFLNSTQIYTVVSDKLCSSDDGNNIIMIPYDFAWKNRQKT